MFKHGQDWSCWRSVCLLAQEIPTRQGMFCLLEEGEFESILQGWSRTIERIGEEMRDGIINILRIRSWDDTYCVVQVVAPYHTWQLRPPSPEKVKSFHLLYVIRQHVWLIMIFKNPQFPKNRNNLCRCKVPEFSSIVPENPKLNKNSSGQVR